jgi:hypothetical protein
MPNHSHSHLESSVCFPNRFTLKTRKTRKKGVNLKLVVISKYEANEIASNLRYYVQHMLASEAFEQWTNSNPSMHSLVHEYPFLKGMLLIIMEKIKSEGNSNLISR